MNPGPNPGSRSVGLWRRVGMASNSGQLRWSETCFSSWTPLKDKRSNKQLFEERVNLVTRWFDLWTHAQREYMLLSLFGRCSGSQLRFCKDFLTKTVPVTNVDLTAVLPRFLSLYIMSFLSPRDLCRAAQVSWHWRVLSEQDCLWAGRCIRRGWFLPYTPAEKEFGAWKKHYVSCVSALLLFTPRVAAEVSGTRVPRSTEEEDDSWMERRIREQIRKHIQDEKRLSLRSRKAWGSNVNCGGSQTLRQNSGISSKSWPSLPWPPHTYNSGGSPADDQAVTEAQSLGIAATLTAKRLPKARGVSKPAIHSAHPDSPVLLMLVSNRVPAYELVLGGVRADVAAVLYDHRGTLPALFTRAERAVAGRSVQRVALLCPGGTEEVHVLEGSCLTERTLLNPGHREFWEKLSGRLAPAPEGGGIELFCPLAASASGVALLHTLSSLTGLEVWCPVGLATGSFQSILGDWSGPDVCPRLSDGDPAAPALRYVHAEVLQSWCSQAESVEEALGDVRISLESTLQRVSEQARGRALGFALWELMDLDRLREFKEVSAALTQALGALTRHNESKPLEFLSDFLKDRSEKSRGGAAKKEEDGEEQLPSLSNEAPAPELPQTVFDWRAAAVQELHRSETLFVRKMNIVLTSYQDPLTAALHSNRAILSRCDVQIIFTPLLHLLQLHRSLQADLQTRLQQWSAGQRVGDVFVKLGSKLKVYTNFLNNYPTTLQVIDRCREENPDFRAFLKRTDRTLTTQMLSLQELLLCPVQRIHEYVMLLQVLSTHTNHQHPDRNDLGAALDTMLQLRQFALKLKQNSEADTLLEETQRSIQGCPNLKDTKRQLIKTQNASLFRSPDDEETPESLRAFVEECEVRLFLFSDALVLTRKKLQHMPFKRSHRSTCVFVASVALDSLVVREILHTRYVSHAFMLEGPYCSWVCATERGEEREHFLSVLRSAIRSAVTGQEEGGFS